MAKNADDSIGKLREQLDADGGFLTQRMKNWQDKPTIHFLLFYWAEEASQLAETLDTLRAQLYSDWCLTVISDVPAPDAYFATLPILQWIQAPVAAHQTTLASAIAKIDDAWFGLLRPGDQLEPQALLLLVDYININPSWKMIYTDEDCFDATGKIVEQLNKPDFDQTQLQQADFIRHGVFLSKVLFQQIEQLPKLCGSSRQLGLKVAEQAGDYSIGHIPVVLYHTAIGEKVR